MGLSALMALAAAGFLPMFYHRDQSGAWPTTSGVIRVAALKTTFEKPGSTTRFSPFICYSYTVDGIGRASTRIDFGDPMRLTRDEVLAWIERNYPVGREVRVYYDSGDPDLAVLAPGAKGLVVIGWWAVGTAGCCLAICWVLLRRRKARGLLWALARAGRP